MSARAVCAVGVLFLVLLGPACVRPQPSPAELLDQSLHAFHGHLVFQRFDQAAGFLPADTRTDFLTYYDDQRDDFHITEYEVTRLEVTGDQKTAKAQVSLSWYRLPSMKVHTSRMDESWRFDETSSRWEVFEQRTEEEPDSP